MSLVEIKALAKRKLRADSPVLKQLLSESDYLPLTPASHTKIVMYWALVTASLGEG